MIYGTLANEVLFKKTNNERKAEMPLQIDDEVAQVVLVPIERKLHPHVA